MQEIEKGKSAELAKGENIDHAKNMLYKANFCVAQKYQWYQQPPLLFVIQKVLITEPIFV